MLGFKPQPLNYSAQAEAALRKLAPLAVADGNSDEARIMVWMADQIRDAVHFVMPEDGRIFNDSLKGIEGEAAHLPFPKITLEYFSDQDPGLSTEGRPLYKATRRVLLAIEMSFQELLVLARNLYPVALPQRYIDVISTTFRDGVIFVTGVFFLECEVPLWSPCYAGWLLPMKGWDEVEQSNKIEPLSKVSAGARGIVGRPFPIFIRAWMEMMDNMGMEMTDRHIANDIGVESGVILELIEALSCSNVKIGTLQAAKPNVNARRIRDGKLPLYETKILTVNVSPKSHKEARGSLDGERASPGEHLRRGHIQSYNTRSGRVNLWKQSITVAAGSPRAIKKSYKVKKGF